METESIVNTPIRIERVLCPVDFSDVSAKAFHYAQSVACHYHAQLILQHVIESFRYPEGDFAALPAYYDEFRQALITKAQGELRLFLDLYGGVEPDCVIEDSTATDAILSLARARDASLIVMGTHGRRGFDHLMLGSATERVLRHSPCPVLAIPARCPDETGTGLAADSVEVRQILCCVDFSKNSERALDHAISLAGAFGADLTTLHVISDPTDVVTETDDSVEKLQKLVAPSLVDPEKIHFEVRLGKAYREILDFAADAKPDLIVMGVRGRNALDLAVFGSTTYRVVQLSTAPVLTVPI